MNSRNSKLIFNLSATFVSDMMTEEDFNLIMEKCSILIGNSDEFDHLPNKTFTEKYPQLTVIITNGGDPIKVVSKDGINLIQVPPIPSDLIVDTNGAGDAFVGGILAALHSQKSLTEAIELGTLMASCVIKKSGTNPPSIEEISNKQK